MSDIEKTLAERESHHGDFKTHAEIEMQLRDILVAHGSKLSNVQFIGLGMIMHKIARVLNNGNNHADTWHDIAGYAIRVEQDING